MWLSFQQKKNQGEEMLNRCCWDKWNCHLGGFYIFLFICGLQAAKLARVSFVDGGRHHAAMLSYAVVGDVHHCREGNYKATWSGRTFCIISSNLKPNSRSNACKPVTSPLSLLLSKTSPPRESAAPPRSSTTTRPPCPDTRSGPCSRASSRHYTRARS